MIFCEKATQRHLTQYLDLFVTYREGFNMNTGNRIAIVIDENPSFIHQSMSSTLVFDSVKIEEYFLPLNTLDYGTLDYDAHKITDVEDSINHVFKSMTTEN